MSDRIAALVLSFVIVLGATRGFAAQTKKADQFDFSRNVGLFAANGKDQFCLSIKNGELKPGQEITLVWAPVEGASAKPEIGYAKVTKKVAGPCDPFNQGDGDATFRLDAGKLERGRVCFALVGRHADLRITPGQVTGRLGADNEISFRSCTSMEGLHLFVTVGRQANVKKAWHSYYYLGYDVEPTCKESDF
jgi:hypothetical protein